MTRKILLTGVVLAALAACERASDPIAVDPVAGSDVPLPWRITGMDATVPGTFTVHQKSSGSSQIIGWCDEAAGVVRSSAPGTGTGTHIGRFEAAQTMCVNTVTGSVTEGVATLTVANGDKIFMTFEGQTVPVPGFTLGIQLESRTIGGTGRFAGAEGEGTAWVVKPTESSWTSTGTGWLRYTASNRSNP